LSAHFSKSLFT